MPKTGRPVVNIDGTERPITGHKCPVIRLRSITGPFSSRTLFENAENRTSGFRTFTVCISKRLILSDNMYIENR